MQSFRQIGDDVYTCVAPAGFEKDPAVTAAIQEFDPGVIPFWLLQIWEIDGKEQTFVYHGIGRYYPFPRHLRRQFHVDMPAGAGFPAPNFLDAIFSEQNCPRYYQGGPAEYLPWDWSVYYWCRKKYETLTIEAYDKRVQAHLARIIAMMKAHREEIEYRKKELEPWIMRQLERVSEYDWKQLLARQHRNAVARKLGMAPERLRDPKAFVHVKESTFAPIAFRSPRDAQPYGRVAPTQGEGS